MLGLSCIEPKGCVLLLRIVRHHWLQYFWVLYLDVIRPPEENELAGRILEKFSQLLILLDLLFIFLHYLLVLIQPKELDPFVPDKCM